MMRSSRALTTSLVALIPAPFTPRPEGKSFCTSSFWRFSRLFTPKGIPLEISYLLLSVAKSKMAKETLIVFVNLIIHECLLPHQLVAHAMLEALDDFLENGLIEHHFLACHHADHIAACEQFATLPGIYRHNLHRARQPIVSR